MKRLKGNIQELLLDKLGNNPTEKGLSILKREMVEKPVIYIGAGTCGLGAGAGKTMTTTTSESGNRSIAGSVFRSTTTIRGG